MTAPVAGTTAVLYERRLIAEHPLRDAYQEAERIWEPVYLSEDAQEGPAAFAAKRPPAWKGR